MATKSPKKTLERLSAILNAFEQIAPEARFGGLGAAQFQEQVNRSAAAREQITDLEDQLTDAIARRDDVDRESLRQAQLIVNGVVGDPAFGPDSPLYEAMGFVRKSNRKSGLTRKTKEKPATG
jgi:hypothetical protein